MSIHQFPGTKNPRTPSEGNGGGKPPMDIVERVARIEATMTTLATKEDLVRLDGSLRTEMHKELNSQSWRIIGAMITFGSLLAAAIFFISKHTA